MVTDRDIVKICAGSYDPAFSWDHLWTDDIYVGVVNNVLCFRGSITLEDWFRDLDAVPINDPLIGGVHCGFARGIHEFFTKNMQLFDQDTIVCGHSLGAARALICAGYMAQNGTRPRAVVTFGSPLPGFTQLARLLETTPQRSYKNRYDPVTSVPLPFYPNLPYIHPSELISINVEPLDFGFFADHHINLYVQGTPDTEIGGLY